MNRNHSTTDQTFLKSQNWCRLTVCLNNPVKDALIAILHNTINNPNINALPSDPTKLYNFMVYNQSILIKLKKNKVLKQDQLNQLLPQEGKVVSDALDITLLRLLIQTFSGILNEDGHWREPRHDDHSIAAAVFRAVNIRNKVIHHAKPTSMSDQEFNDIWCQIEKTLIELNYLDDISDYKKHDFDPILIKQLHSNMAQDFENILLAYKEKSENKDVLKNFVERKYQNISTKQIESDIGTLLENHESVMVSAEAGLGKTFSAKNMRYLWASGEILKGKKLLFIDSKRVNRYMYKPSYAAPIYVSELGDVLKNKTDEYLESFGCVKKSMKDLIVIIDGVDELSIEENNLELDLLKQLQSKIDENKEISAMETIIGIYFGLFFPGSKIIAFGRKNEIERLQGIQDQLQQSTLFNKQIRAVYELLPLDDQGVKELISLTSCNNTSCSCEKCANTYGLVKDVQFRNVPSHLIALLKIFEYLPNQNFGRITKTKIFIITIFNLLKNHTQTVILKDVKTFNKLLVFDKAQEFRECIQKIAKISVFALLNGNITIKVEEYNEDDINYFRYNQIYDGENICITIKRDILEQLDFFYVRDLEYYVLLEPYHLTNMEFLASCYIYCYSDERDLLLKLKGDRKTTILPYVAGLHSNENFTRDFVSEVLENSNLDIKDYINWLFSIENVHYRLPESSWYGVKENGQLFPSFDLLHRINEEVDVFDELSKRMKEVQTLICYCNDDFECWYEMKNFTHRFITNDRNKYNIKSFISTFKEYKIIIKFGYLRIDLERFKSFLEMPDNDQLKLKSMTLNLLHKGKKYDSRTIDLILSALLPQPTTTSTNTCPVIQCKRLDIKNIRHFNGQLTEKLFTIGLCDVVDSIALCSTFFKDRQLKILKNMEHKYSSKHINIELVDVQFNRMFELPKLGNRHVSLNNVNDVTDNDVINFRQHMSPRYCHNLSNYKIIERFIPFVRKKNYSKIYAQSLYLNLWRVDFKQVAPKVFANTFSLISSLACTDDDSVIPSLHWLSLAQIEDCQINELRIWKPLTKNFEHLLSIKTSIIQFIHGSKDRLKELLNHIVNNQNVQSDKEIKVFVVKYDYHDWDDYEEKMLFSSKTIEEYKNNYSSDDLLLDDIPLPFYEGKQHIKHWCCEISLPCQKNIDLVTSFSDNDYEASIN